LTATYKETLTTLEISSDGLVIRDGSGLSKKNQVSARTIVELLTVIRNDIRFISIYAGLPIAGKTGTLKNRFEKAPGAIGQVRAKTGWVNNSVTLAGYAVSGEKEYAFAILADGITPTLKGRNAARRAMDRLLETIVMGDH
jgi:D-alanyl-D-alanine carboxypeptidase